MSEKKPANSCPTCALLFLHPKEPQTKRTARVEELLRCNNPPLDAELTDFRLLAKKGLEIFQDLDEKIVLAREMLDNLLQARSQAESHLADAKFLIHPMRSLPYEVVAEIFSHCVSTWTMDEGRITWPGLSRTARIVGNSEPLDTRSAPWTLTHELDGDTSHQMLRVFLERSKDLPLSVYLFSFREIDEHPLFHVLAATIPRWKQLKISIPLVSWPSLSGNIFSSLETLVQSYNANIDSGFATDPDISTFNVTSVPVLRAFKADPYAPWDVFDHIHLPWSKFIRVINVPTDDIDAYKYLEQMTNLEELTVLVMNPAGDSPIWHIPVSLPSLLRLTLKERDDPDAKDLQSFFSILDIPALFDLRLDFQSGIHHFPRLQPTTQDRLTCLSISCAMTRDPGNVQSLLRFLSDTPHVENFHLVDKEMTVDFVYALKISPASSPLLPCLRMLDISDCFCDDELADDESVIYDMLQSRYGTGVMSISPPVNPTSVVASLETVRVPRWLYFKDDDRWEEICRNLKVECGITMKDDGWDVELSDIEDSDSDSEE